MNRRPTTQDISWFLDLYYNKQLDLNPPYQRRSVWTKKDKEYFLDTIFRDYPCPAIFLYKESEGKKTTYYVVDGKQRLETILDFINNKIAIPKDFGDLKLNGKKWKDIEDIDGLNNRFWDYVITVEFVKSIDGTVLNTVFDRLNRNSWKLERQELRHAKYDGWLISFAEAESEKKEWKDLKVVTAARARRMKDVQFFLELLLVVIDEKIVGFDQDSLDKMCAKYNDFEEIFLDYQEDDFIDEVETIKDYLKKMEAHNQCITNYAKNVGNFYTVWAVVALNYDALPDTNVLAESYGNIMEKVKEISSKDNPMEFFEQLNDKDIYINPFKYAENAKGASTDLAQRKNRYDALCEELVK